MNHLMTRTLALAAASTLLLGGHAMASPIVVLNDGASKDLIISRGDYYIHMFSNELTIDPYVPTEYPAHNSVRIAFDYILGGVLVGGISGNALAEWPPLPIPTPALVSQGGLRLKDQFIDTSYAFAEPYFDPTDGGTNVAAISHGTSPFSDFNLSTFTQSGDMAYIGYASSDFSIFGYMQIERVTEVDWKLIGYAFDTSGSGILVEQLVVPGPSMLGLLAAPLAMRSKRRA
jgi:hypothetical protein